MDGTAIGDEFAGCSLEDIALAVGYAAPGSDDQEFALAALRRRLPPGRDHNQPPLDELLDELLEPFRKRRDDLVAVARTAVVVDDETAGKTLDLAQMCRAFETEIDTRRKELVKPHRDAEKLINDAHNRLRLDVQVARQGMNGISGLRGMLTAWDTKKKAAAAEAQAEARREAEASEQAAETARQNAAAAVESGKGAVTAELAALQATEDAGRARAAAAPAAPAPTRGHLGQLSRKREINCLITDPDKLIDWLKGRRELHQALRVFLEETVDKHLRSLGVETVARGVDIPGVSAWVEEGAAFARQ